MITYLFPLLALTSNCSSSKDPVIDHVLHGTITYPFQRNHPLGHNGPSEKLIVRSIEGTKQYVIEFPSKGNDYDIEIPMSSESFAKNGMSQKPSKLANPARTDQELVHAMQDKETNQNPKTKFLDKAFGMRKGSSPRQSPSYAVGLAKIKRLYQERQYEFSLIEINNLLSFFPTSIKLYKMKGTIYSRMNELKLAEKAWLKALELSPYDRMLRNGLKTLRERINQQTLTSAADDKILKPFSQNNNEATNNSPP